MGLDMYLTGDKYAPSFGENEREVVDGYEVESQRLKMGYWRKYWALHNYIDDNYESNSEGRVYLESEDLRDIGKAVADGKLVDPDDLEDMPYRSVYAYWREPEQVRETVNTFRKAADWVDGGDWRSVEYVGSW